MAINKELSTSDQSSRKLSDRPRKSNGVISNSTHSLDDAVSVSLHSIMFRQSRDSKSCCSSDSSRTGKKSAACSENLRASSFRIIRSDPSLHRDPSPTRQADVIGRSSTPRIRRATKNDTPDIRRSLSKSSRSTDSETRRSSSEKRSALEREQQNNHRENSNKRSVSSNRTRSSQLKGNGEKSESSRSLKSRPGSSCHSTQSQKSHNAAASSSEGRKTTARSNSCQGRKAISSRQQSFTSRLSKSPDTLRQTSKDWKSVGSMDRSGRSTSSRKKGDFRSVPKRSNSDNQQRGVDPPPTCLTVKTAEMKDTTEQREAPLRALSLSQKTSDRARPSSLDKAIRPAQRTMEKARENRRSVSKTSRSSSGRTKKKLGHAISNSFFRTVPLSGKGSNLPSPQNKLADRYTPTPTKGNLSLERSSSFFLTAQDSLSLIEMGPIHKGSADLKHERKLRHSKSCSGAAMFRTSESLDEDSSEASISPVKRAFSLGSSHFQSLQDSLSLINLSPSHDEFDINDNEHHRRSQKSKSFSGIAMYVKSTPLESPVKKPKLVSKHYSQRTCAFQDVPRTKSLNSTYQRECFRSAY